MTGELRLPAAMLAADAKKIPASRFMVINRRAAGGGHANGRRRAGTGFEPVGHGPVIVAVEHQLAAFLVKDILQFRGIGQRLAG
jgi:hypothetical protein